MKSRVIKIGKHLYFVTEEKIEKGDWVMSLERETEWHRESEMVLYKAEYMDQIHPDDRKIVASNDAATKLPEPPKEFVDYYFKIYNDYNVDNIELVDIEYVTEWYNEGYGWQPFPDHKTDIKRNITKTDYNNCITIRPFKDSWSEEEVEQLLWECYTRNEPGRSMDYIDNVLLPEFRKWIKENLHEKNNNT